MIIPKIYINNNISFFNAAKLAKKLKLILVCDNDLKMVLIDKKYKSFFTAKKFVTN